MTALFSVFWATTLTSSSYRLSPLLVWLVSLGNLCYFSLLPIKAATLSRFIPRRRLSSFVVVFIIVFVVVVAVVVAARPKEGERLSLNIWNYAKNIFSVNKNFAIDWKCLFFTKRWKLFTNWWIVSTRLPFIIKLTIIFSCDSIFIIEGSIWRRKKNPKIALTEV